MEMMHFDAHAQLTLMEKNFPAEERKALGKLSAESEENPFLFSNSPSELSVIKNNFEAKVGSSSDLKWTLRQVEYPLVDFMELAWLEGDSTVS